MRMLRPTSALIALAALTLTGCQSADFRAHQILFADGIAGFENLANLDRLPAQGFHVIALPMKIEGGSGGPARIVALLPDGNDT